MLPQIARGESNKMWIIPSELTESLSGIGRALGGRAEPSKGFLGQPSAGSGVADGGLEAPLLEDPEAALARARAGAAGASRQAREADERTSSGRAARAEQAPGTTAAATDPVTPDRPSV